MRAMGQPAPTLTIPPPAAPPSDLAPLVAAAAEYGIEILGPPPDARCEWRQVMKAIDSRYALGQTTRHVPTDCGVAKVNASSTMTRDVLVEPESLAGVVHQASGMLRPARCKGSSDEHQRRLNWSRRTRTRVGS